MTGKKASDEEGMRELFRTPAGQSWMRKALLGEVGEADSLALHRERARIQAGQAATDADGRLPPSKGGTSSTAPEK